ncbi:MAG: M18 family aminopeptidase [Candidatus Delongbacteria bacterium]|nr:MAG: M18 family aminopeptidase [Candidatus Delongbacteria bacterium]
MTSEKQFARDLIDFIYESPSSFQTVRNIKAALLRGGFRQLNRNLNWNIERGGKYFVTKNDSALIAFITGAGKVADNGFKVIAAHTDFPALKLKPQAFVKSPDNYLKINVETYGSPILNTWLDRPLSMAGRVVLRSNNPLLPETKFINLKKPVSIIPNIAVHLDKNINTGKTYNKQNDMQPILRTVQDNFENDNYLLELLASHTRTQVEKILDFDLVLYEATQGEIIGAQEEFISSARIDDLAMVHAGVDALLNSGVSNATNIMICFDNEEVGSGTKQGAHSPFVKNILKRIAWALSPTEKDAFFRAKINSFGISADMAHAVHPNSPQLHDSVLRPKINAGPVLKYNANQKYTTDAISAAVFKSLCERAKVPYQQYANRSDISGGSTLGSILSSQLDFRMVDIGNPMLAMHSIRELSGVKDHYYMKKVFEEFYKL